MLLCYSRRTPICNYRFIFPLEGNTIYRGNSSTLFRGNYTEDYL